MANIDPNKYSKNRNIKPDSALNNAVAMGRMALMVIGLIGIAVEFFKPDGAIKNLLGKLFQTTTSMLLIPVIIVVLWSINRWLTSPNKSETAKNGDLPMYLMMAAGAYYLFRLITLGTF